MKRGISLVVVVITLIVISILMGVIILNMENFAGMTDIAKLQVDISELEHLVSIYKTRKSGIIDFLTVEFDVSNLSENEVSQFEGETITNNKIELYVIDLDKIDATQTNFGNLSEGVNDRYIYSNNTGKVYYEKGLNVDNEIFYRVNNGE